ncbi:hypothetical protein, partial [Streptomyces sp. NRRL S-1896]|uniref:VOC family protein n=1 Tax=Streptomyces sp. NRRL S-1896 TaxID=1463893 RepID=UPI0004CDC0E6
ALAADPEGAVFGLWQPGEREGFEKQNDPGSFCWTEVYTRQPDRVDPFYEKVFGFRAADPDEAGHDVLVEVVEAALRRQEVRDARALRVQLQPLLLGGLA